MDIVQAESGLVVVSLSRANLEGLLHQLDCGARDAQIMRRTERGMMTVLAQESDVHYGDRQRGVSDGSDVDMPRLSPQKLSGLEAHSPGADGA